MRRRRIVIMGAAGRDFHNFNVVFRADRHSEVRAFTAAQIPDIEGRTYPRALAGPLYPRGIRVYPESELPRLIERLGIDEVVFSYSDVSFETVMAKATLANAHGADFRLLGVAATMLAARVPVIAVVAARTGSGKSQTSRAVCAFLHRHGLRVVAVRHPMPYGDLARQAVQRFSSLDDLRKQKCTIEEMEEYEPHIGQGTVVYAGVDYGLILRAAEREADVIVWDGGNNDTSFYRPDLTLAVLDPHRAGHELVYYPGATNLRLADVVIVNKVDSAPAEDVVRVVANVLSVNPRATVLRAASPLTVDDPAVIRGRRVLAIEDGPTVTHGGMRYGAGILAAKLFGAREIVDPRPYAVGSLARTFEAYPATGPLLPAMGYGPRQVRDLERTIARVPCDAVVIGTPVDLRRIVRLDKPATRVTYALDVQTKPGLEEVLAAFLKRVGAAPAPASRARGTRGRRASSPRRSRS
jgi:predicted GTPase